MLEATVIGNLGSDAVIKDFGGSKFISFNVAHSERYTDRNGNPTERTTWLSVLKPAREDDRLCQYLTKGTQVYLRGNISARVYQGKDGLYNAALNIHCTHLQLLSSSARQQDPQAAPAPAQSTAPVQSAYAMPDSKDDIPWN